MTQEIKPLTWLKGKIIRYVERYRPHEYVDVYMKSEGITSSEIKVSFPNSEIEGSKLKNFLNEFKCENKEELIGKEIYYKYYDRRIIQNGSSRIFHIAEDYNVKSVEEYKFEIRVKEIIENEKFISVKLMNDFFGLETRKKNKFEPVSVKQYIDLYQSQRVFSPVCEIDFESYYLNITLENQINPSGDNDGLFLKTINRLDKIRASNVLLGEKVWKIKELKIFSNSLIGALNNPEFCFYDPNQYFSIIREGRLIMKRVIQDLESTKEEYSENGDYLQILRVHTDGIHLRVKSLNCKNELVPALNKYLEMNKSFRYKLKYKGYYQRGLFKSVNDFVLWTEGQEMVNKGSFFKDYPELTEAFMEGYYNPNTYSNKDYSKYDKLKEKLLKNPTKKLGVLIDFLEGSK